MVIFSFSLLARGRISRVHETIRRNEENRPSSVFISLLLHPFRPSSMTTIDSLYLLLAKISSLIITVIFGFSLLARDRISHDSKRRIVLLPSFYPSSSILSSFFDGDRFSLSSTRAKISSLIIMVIIMVIVSFSLHVVEFRAYDSKGRGELSFFRLYIPPLPSFHPSSMVIDSLYLLFEQRFLLIL